MSNPFIPLSKAAIAANLTKNEGLIFIALTVQTLGYRKAVDNLTDKRLAQLTGIRLDHLRPALDSFLDHQLFTRVEHKHYDYQYRLCDEFLDEASPIVYPPSLPSPSLPASPETGETRESRADFPDAGGKAAPRSVDFPDGGGHTTENPYIKNQQQKTKTTFNQKQQTEPKKNTSQKKQTEQTEPKKNISQEQPQPPITLSMAGFDSLPDSFVIESSQPIRIEFSTKKPDTAAVMAEVKKEAIKIEKVSNAEPISEPSESNELSEKDKAAMILNAAMQMDELSNKCDKNDSDNDNVAEMINDTTQVIVPIEISEPSDNMPVNAFVAETSDNSVKPMADLTAAVAIALAEQAESVSTNEEPSVVVDEKEVKKTLKIPESVGEENYNACNRYFDLLDEEQQQSVLTVFFYNLKLGGIRNKARYFIGLAKKAQENKLTVPAEATAKNISQGPLSYEQFIAQKKKDEKNEEHLSYWADYTWIQRQSKVLKKTEEETAAMMGLEKAYAMFKPAEVEAAVA